MAKKILASLSLVLQDTLRPGMEARGAATGASTASEAAERSGMPEPPLAKPLRPIKYLMENRKKIR